MAGRTLEASPRPEPRDPPGMTDHGAQGSIVRSEVDVKRWAVEPPSVDAVRPRTCPRCGQPGDQPGRRLGLHGHGLRDRQIRGPLQPGGQPALVVLQIRRYRCQGCCAVVTVLPREAAPRRHYSAPAIAWALALFGLMGLPLAEVRARTSPWSVVGAAAAGAWASLRRWIEATASRRLFRRLRCPPDTRSRRHRAGQIATTVAAHAPPTVSDLPIAARAFLGAVHAC